MIAIEQYRAAIRCFHAKCVLSNKHLRSANINELLKFIVISLMNWIQESIDTCFGSLLNFTDLFYIPCENVLADVDTIRMGLMFCIPVLQFHVLVLWLL